MPTTLSPLLVLVTISINMRRSSVEERVWQRSWPDRGKGRGSCRLCVTYRRSKHKDKVANNKVLYLITR